MTRALSPPLTDLAPVFQVLADRSRLAILESLRGGELTVGALAAAAGLDRSLASHHLATLTGVGLVRVRRDPDDGRRNLISLNPGPWLRLASALQGHVRSPGRDDAGLDSRAAALRDQPYFASLARPDMATVAGLLREERYGAGETIFLEGDPCPGLYVVAEGQVKIYTTSPDGREQVLRIMAPGDSFNEVPAFDGGPNPASAAAVQRSVVYVLPAEDVAGLLRTSPVFSAAVARVLAARLRHLVALVEDLSFRHVVSRVAKILLQTVQPGEGVGAGVGQRPLTQREIADMAGTAREVVSRALRTLEGQGVIGMERGRIVILDRRRLQEV